jgi:ankyrin repeat protein
VAALLVEGRANPRLQDKRGQDALMKLVRRDFDGPAAGCAWTWEVLQEQRLMGPELRSVDVSDIESAMVAAEADGECVGFSIGRPARGGEPRLSFHGRAQAASFAPGPEDSENDEDAIAWTSYLKIEADVAHDVQALIVAGADACAVDASGFTALHHHLVSAPGRGSGPVVAALLRAGSDVNRRDRTARATTPLLLAVSARRADLVERMLRDAWPPADVDARAADGTSALALAESLGASKVAQLLRGAGASAWADAEVVLGKRTTFTFDTRAPPVPA